MKEKEHRSGFVSIVGRPNVGKSTLLNRMVGAKVAIVSDKPQTTRNRIQAVLTRPEAQVIFLDTPGIHKAKHRLGQYMVKVALQTLKEVDLVLFIVEAHSPFGPGDKFVLNRLKDAGTPAILGINKIDLVPRESLLPLISDLQQKHDFTAIVPVSALKGDNMDGLVAEIIRHLPPGPRYYPAEAVTDQPEQFVIAELIREKVLQLTREEVPHGVTVVVEEVVPRHGKVLFIRAVVYTEKDSHKGILLGGRGRMVKKVGQMARAEIEALFGTRVYLDLWVKVKQNWRRNETFLGEFGYRPDRW
ncbi:MAG: GTPase Era [Ammonifex sp.]|jgi:GTP-binding protein Era|nr:MAG: GTPase Era [Ammonifex sp.]